MKGFLAPAACSLSLRLELRCSTPTQDLRSFSTCVLKTALTTSLPQSLSSATRLLRLPGLLSPTGSSQVSSREMDKFSQCHKIEGRGD